MSSVVVESVSRAHALKLFRDCLRLIPVYASSPTVRKYYRLELLKDCKLKDMPTEHVKQVMHQFDENDALLRDIVRSQLRATVKYSGPSEKDYDMRVIGGREQLDSIKQQLQSEGLLPAQPE